MDNQHSQLIKELVKISPRRGIGEQKACELIQRHLTRDQIPYEKQSFTTKIPVTKEAYLIVDDKEIPCIGTSFVSGEFSMDSPILNSYDAKSDQPAIVFSPVSKGICLQGYKSFPAMAVNRDVIVKLMMANSISGKVEVSTESFESTNILVGNMTNPKKIIFAHYDSIVGSGAIDNAGSVDVLYHSFSTNRHLLRNNLFVFAGSEEESLSRPESCYGFEVFDQEHKTLLDNTEQLIVLDGIGVGAPSFVDTHADWVFWISRIDALSEKILWMQNDQSHVMQYYHTELDTLDKLKPQYIQDARDLLLSQLI